MKKGFTLIEVIFAIFLVTVTAFAAFTLIDNTLVAVSSNKIGLTAYYLAQEGIELVRNIRDNNWLESRTGSVAWNDGLAAGDWEMDYNDTALSAYTSRYLYLENSTKLFSYIESPNSLDEETKFQRKITISDLSSDIIEVKITVYWVERSRTHRIEVISQLTNWK